MKNFRKVISIFTAALIVLSCVSVTTAAATVPEKVRIGLYYEDTAVGSFSVSAPKGLQLGFMKDGKFNVLAQVAASSQITVKKDSDLHIQIGGNYNDSTSAGTQIQALQQKGIKAYPVYADTWQIWTGSYADQNAAQADIAANVEKKLGKGDYRVVQASAKSIASTDTNGNILLVFAGLSTALQVHPKTENSPYALNINNWRSYRGELEIQRFSGSDMTVINVVPMDQYLYGVVPCELEADSPLEALKAQAVAARTYTLNNLGKHDKWGFDLSTTTSDQVYKGLNYEEAASNQAVDETKGKVVTYNGNPAEVFYFASSGGKTEDSKNVWGADLPYLKSVDDKYESGKSWHYTWEVSLTAQRIMQIMQSKKYDLGEILNVQVTKTSEAGRAIELTITGTKDKKVFTNSACRSVFGLDSQWFTVSGGSNTGSDGRLNVRLGNLSIASVQLSGQKIITSSGLKTLIGVITVVDGSGQKRAVSSSTSRGSDSGIFKISGRGWGHGVGMSQEGAKGMAKAGFTYDEILTHYFQGTKIE